MNSATTVAELIEAATAFAWLPLANLPAGPVYDARREAHARFVKALAEQPPITWRALPPDIGRALKRAAAVTVCNRRGFPYYERKSAVLELRGALDAHRMWLS